MPSWARRCGGREVMSTSSHTIFPERIGSTPTSARRKLDLPTPLRPSRQVTWPFCAANDTLRSGWLGPEERLRVSTCSTSAAEIDFDHALVGLDLVDRSFGQHAALVQHGHFRRERAH